MDEWGGGELRQFTRMKFLFAVSAALSASWLVLGAAESAKPKPAAYLTEAEARAAGPDFDLQGEYADAAVGAQVIALGEEKFRLVVAHMALARRLKAVGDELKKNLNADS